MSRSEQYKRVVVVGAGSTACALLPMLAAMPDTLLTLVDGDTITLHNLVRQTLYGPADAGRMKVAVARERLAVLVAPREITVHPVFLDMANASGFLQGATLVCDCTDDLNARRLIANTCATLGLPLVWGAVHAAQVQVGSWPGHGPAAMVFQGMPAMEQDGCDMQDVPAHATTAAAALMAMHARALLDGDERYCSRLELLDLPQGRWLRLHEAPVPLEATAYRHDLG